MGHEALEPCPPAQRCPGRHGQRPGRRKEGLGFRVEGSERSCNILYLLISYYVIICEKYTVY